MTIINNQDWLTQFEEAKNFKVINLIYLVCTNWWNDFMSYVMLLQEGIIDFYGEQGFKNSSRKLDNSKLIKEGDFEKRKELLNRMKAHQKDNIKTVQEFFMINPTLSINKDYNLMSPQVYEMAIQVTGGGPSIRLFVSEREADVEKEQVITYAMVGPDINENQVIELDTIQLGIIIQEGENSILEIGYYPKKITIKGILTSMLKGSTLSDISADLSHCKFGQDEKQNESKLKFQGSSEEAFVSLEQMKIEENSIIIFQGISLKKESSKKFEANITNSNSEEDLLKARWAESTDDSEFENQMLNGSSPIYSSMYQHNQELNKRRTGEQYCQEIKTQFGKNTGQSIGKPPRGNRYSNNNEMEIYPEIKGGNTKMEGKLPINSDADKIIEEEGLNDSNEKQLSQVPHVGSQSSIRSDVETPSRRCKNQIHEPDPEMQPLRGNRRGNTLKRKKVDNSNDSTEENGESAQETEDLGSMSSRNIIIELEQGQLGYQRKILKEEVEELKEEINKKMNTQLKLVKLSSNQIAENLKLLIDDLSDKIRNMKHKTVKKEYKKQEHRDNISEEDETTDRKGENFSDITSQTSTQPDHNKQIQSVSIKNTIKIKEQGSLLDQPNISDCEEQS